MFEPSVSRTKEFMTALEFLFDDDYTRALDQLTRLRHDFAMEEHSVFEIDRWIAQALEGLGRKEEALELLLALERGITVEEYELSCHHYSLANLLVELGRVEDLIDYCRGITSFVPSGALGHLDWMLLYAECSKNPRPNSLMVDILVACAFRLGITFTVDDVADTDWSPMVRFFIKARDEANRRYATAWASIVTASPGPGIHILISNYINSEPSPFFRNLLKDALAEAAKTGR
jgi:tetratricopeptide (TPR) repeat protein